MSKIQYKNNLTYEKPEKYDQIASKTLRARQEDQHPGVILEDWIG